MKGLLTTGLILTILPLSANAGDCTSNAGTPVTDFSVFAGNTVCGTSSTNTDTWQEWHQGSAPVGGTLTEYALGSGDPVDPTHDVGSWSATPGTNTITYNYGAGQVYPFDVYVIGSTYIFCGTGGATNEVARATVKGGQQGC